MNINIQTKYATCEIYSYRVTQKPNAPVDEIGLRPEVPSHLRIDSPLNSVIELTRSALTERLTQQISTLSKNYLNKLILSGLKRNLTLNEALKPLNLSANDPRITSIQSLYENWAKDLWVISLEEMHSLIDSGVMEKIRGWNPSHKDQVQAALFKVNSQNAPLISTDFVKELTFALSPCRSQLSQDEFMTLNSFHKDCFSSCNLTRLIAIAEELGVECDLSKLKDEIQNVVGTPENRKKAGWNNNNLIAKEMLNRYKMVLKISKEKGQPIVQHNPPIKKKWPDLERELIYIEEFGKNIQPGKANIPAPQSTYISLLKRPYEEIIKLRKAQLKELIAEGLKDLSDSFSDQEVLKSRFSVINTVLAEQEKHSFSRFYQLPYYFYSFAHTVTSISGYLRNQSISSDYIETVKAILRDPQSDTKKPSYRKKQFMGQDRIDPKDEAELLANLNSGLLLSALDKEFSPGVQRSHTLPYPGLFSWESSAFENNIAEEARIDLGNTKDHQFIKIKKDLFLSFKNREITQEEFTEKVIQKLEKERKKSGNPQQLYHFSLLFLKVFYLRLFSETQLMPDVINQIVDKFSEWHSKTKGTYKDALRDALIALIDLAANQQRISEEDAIRVLNDYYIEPIVSETEKACKDQSLEKPRGLFMLINATQVHQSMLKILRNPEIESRLETFWMEKAKRFKA